MQATELATRPPSRCSVTACAPIQGLVDAIQRIENVARNDPEELKRAAAAVNPKTAEFLQRCLKDGMTDVAGLRPVPTVNDPFLKSEGNDKTMCYYPIKHPKLHDLYEKAVDCFWTAKEVDLAGDHPEKLDPATLTFLLKILAFFASSDSVVMQNLALNFTAEVVSSQAESVYAFQAAMEAIHSEMYSLLIETYVSNTEDKVKLYSSVENMSCVKAKRTWAEQWMGSQDAPFAERLCAFAAVEAIFFSSSFASIFWLKTKSGNSDILPGLFKANEFIARDENMHVDTACQVHSELLPANRVKEERAREIVQSAVDVENDFVKEALATKLMGMNSELMGEYVRFVGDRLLKKLGFAPIYNAKNPFAFMETMCLDGKQNFFEGRVSEYQRGFTGRAADDNVAFDEDC